MLRLSITSLGLLAILCLSLNSLADNGTKEEEARIQFEQGKQFFNESQFEKAAIALERAYELRPSYRILYYLGLAEFEKGNLARAHNAYERYLAEADPEEDAPRIEEVKRELERLSTMVGSIVIITRLEGAKVKINNETVGTTPLTQPILVGVGRHEVSVKLGGENLLVEVVRIAGGQELTFEVQAPSDASASPDRVSTPPESQTPESPQNNDSTSAARTGAWISLGVGAAAGIGAGATGTIALVRANRLQENCPNELCPASTNNLSDKKQTIKNLGLTTDVLLGFAAAGVITGVMLMIFSPKKSTDDINIQATPAITSHGGGMFITGRF